MSKKQILDYRLELEDVKENELPEKDKDKIINFNDNLSNNYGLFGIDVLENDNLYFKGRIISNTKSENNAKLKLLPVTIIQLERILNYLVKNEEYSAKFNDFEIKYQGYYEDKDINVEMFTIYKKRRNNYAIRRRF